MNSVINFFKNLFKKKEVIQEFSCGCPDGCCCGRCLKCQPKIIDIDANELEESKFTVGPSSPKYYTKKSVSDKKEKTENDTDELVVIKKKYRKYGKKKESPKKESPKKESTKKGRPKKDKKQS
jgi:hypothetical protein